MRMCSVGADLAELAGQSFGRELADTLPPGVDTVRVAPVDGAGGLASGVVVAGKVAARVMLDDVEPQTYRVLRAPHRFGYRRQAAGRQRGDCEQGVQAGSH